jgi:hypothetical protein
MAIKTFTTGEVLTASDTNTYLANSGLVYVKQQTVGNTVASVEITSAFSATYEDYKIIYVGGTTSTQNDLAIHLGATAPANGYYQTVIYASYSSATALAQFVSNGTKWTYGGSQENPNSVICEIYKPFETQKTIISGTFTGANSARVGGQMQGFYDPTTSYTSFTIVAGAGTFSGGIVYVYGYRKA